jgi:hypothetical protein
MGKFMLSRHNAESAAEHIKIEARVVPWRDIQRNTSPGFIPKHPQPFIEKHTIHPSIKNIPILAISEEKQLCRISIPTALDGKAALSARPENRKDLCYCVSILAS